MSLTTYSYFGRVLSQLFQHRNDKRCCFTRACPGHGNHVFAVEDERD